MVLRSIYEYVHTARGYPGLVGQREKTFKIHRDTMRYRGIPWDTVGIQWDTVAFGWGTVRSRPDVKYTMGYCGKGVGYRGIPWDAVVSR